MSAVETRTKNKILANIVKWQNERKLESWNDDVLKDEIGMRISENCIVSEDIPESELEIVFESTGIENEYKFKTYTVIEVSEGQYHLSNSKSNSDSK